MHPSQPQEIIIPSLPASLCPPTQDRTNPAKGEAESETAGLDTVMVDGNALLASLRARLSKLQTDKVELERWIETVEATIQIFESSK